MSSYFSIAELAESELMDRGSKFIGIISPINSEEEAKNIMEAVRSQHPKANHLCYAYRIKNEEKIIENLSDDGEPSHSAGQPILRQLQGAELLNVLAMVIRYFGGVKLGVGGLMKAYKNATSEALSKAQIIELKEMKQLSLLIDYSKWGEILGVLDRENISFETENKADHAIVKLKIEKQKEVEIRGLFASFNIDIR